ncbi:phage tail protein [Mucilaginibacter sp. AW1-3]
MSDQLLGEIRPFAGTFAPSGWALCNGQILPIQRYTSLFAILGTQYGGNGTTNFALPNIQGATLVSQGTGPGLSPYVVGETAGSETVAVLQTEMPGHTHTFNAASAGGIAVAIANETNAPATNGTSHLSAFVAHNNNVPPGNIPNTFGYTHTTPVNTQLNAQTVGLTGGTQPHENRAPFITINYCIALVGTFPVRN